MARPNAGETTDLRLRKGNSYRLSMRWLNCDGHNDDNAPWYCWQAQLDGVDIPGAGAGFLGVGGRKSDWRDDEVNGWCDLLDFTPLCMDVSALQVLPEEVREKLMFKIRHDSGAVNVVWTGLSKSSVGTFQNAVVDSCGQELDENSFEATTERVSSDGIEVPEKLVEELRKASSDQGVFFLEGRSATQAPLKFDVYYEDKKLVTGELPLTLSSVEEMYRWLNIRPVAGGNATRQTNLSTPPNFPDAESNGKMFIFVHGYSVSEEGARGWNAEMFKRLWQSGANSMYTAVTWYGDDSRISWFDDITPNYYANVENAFQSASMFAGIFATIPGSEKYIAAHSLGNMLVSSAAVDYNMQYTKYFMLNAAVAREAYDENAYDETMIEPDWKCYTNRLWASNWGTLFPPNDGRNQLTWRGRFAGIMNVVNFYSPTEDVLKPSNGSVPNLGNERSWVFQEMHKGTVFMTIAPGNSEGGWGFNYRYENLIGGNMNTNEAAKISDQQLRVEPFFSPFDEDEIFGTNGSYVASVPNVRRRILADGIPALSNPAGSCDIAPRITSKNLEDYRRKENGVVVWIERADDGSDSSPWRRGTACKFWNCIKSGGASRCM